jgi:hypothetical protein
MLACAQEQGYHHLIILIVVTMINDLKVASFVDHVISVLLKVPTKRLIQNGR